MMNRTQIAQGIYITEIPADKFKRCKVAVNLVLPANRALATARAVLPHVLDRRCEAIPNPTDLSRFLFSLYGAELTSESYIVGANRVLTLAVAGLKNEYALAGENLAQEYINLLCNLLFAPKLANGIFAAEDVAIEKEKQAEYLKSEMNDKRSYCVRQARRKLYGTSPLGIESAGYLEDINDITPKSLYEIYTNMLQHAQIEVLVCGISAKTAAQSIQQHTSVLTRNPQPLADAPPIEPLAKSELFSEPMQAEQGKLCILCTSGARANAHGEVVMRLASAIYGGLPTSRLFMNVREKESLCYYCASSYAYFGGVLSIDSGVEHSMADKASNAILHQLNLLQATPPTEDELLAAKRYLRSAFSTAKDSPDALMSWAFTEWLKGTSRTLDEMMQTMDSVQPHEIQAALAQYKPAVEYRITEK